IKASLIAYAMPLALALTLAGLSQCAEADDATTMMLTFAGLLVGLIAMRIGARRLRARGELAPRFLRRDNSDDTHCIA
ncbi:MAG TPA: SoxR reducing system RseC family protein, partial [Rhodocyclaceae bacterium]|nr:SoxR reducing system RseC family protein [Rhodocyclaceae bacterium]